MWAERRSMWVGAKRTGRSCKRAENRVGRVCWTRRRRGAGPAVTVGRKMNRVPAGMAVPCSEGLRGLTPRLLDKRNCCGIGVTRGRWATRACGQTAVKMAKASHMQDVSDSVIYTWRACEAKKHKVLLGGVVHCRGNGESGAIRRERAKDTRKVCVNFAHREARSGPLVPKNARNRM